ncbi:heme ABC exporter ATP-binding protein CcmA [Novosphingobium cyanobacteriorum]|uniref:Heme ABC exporter ATP-binding protein CcmA n=1 Tax=Novosphingobium cyanobacteriorum TaxID=3024215 RepID=A0ABT6CII8_9SPHN|nr:heme ABC exporter ATP-binding protein CcmA [Novosphingobium cyanobacteriorum]MDF8333334.1 heme ABC exporter ATP-binding protein CcmA [Novosphingobium cyanobacteriorum]
MQPGLNNGARLAAYDIACRRGDRILFKGVSFELAPGDALHLAGPNGIGKSSLIRILCGLLRPYHGHVESTGQIALSDERPALDMHLPLQDALDFWQRIDGAGEGRADFGLENLLDVPVRYLSTGQRKRAGLARMAASGGRIWLLDEPLNGLDTHWGAAAQAAVEAHRAMGGIAVIASHQPLGLSRLRTLSLLDHLP